MAGTRMVYARNQSWKGLSNPSTPPTALGCYP